MKSCMSTLLFIRDAFSLAANQQNYGSAGRTPLEMTIALCTDAGYLADGETKRDHNSC